MNPKTIIVGVISLFFICSPAFALDWVKLNERASSISLADAFKVVEAEPRSLDNLYVLGLVYLDQYKVDEAEKVFKKMLDIDPSNVEAQWGIAECLRRKGQYDICDRLLSEIVKSHPKFAPAYISLAYVKYIKFDFEGSSRLTYRVIKLGKKNVDITNLVRAYGLLAGAKGMIAHYGGPISKVINGKAVMPYLREAQKLQPDAAAVLYGLGSYYLLIPHIFGRDTDKGLDYLEKAAKADPLFSDVYVRIAQAYKAKGDQEKYEFYLNKALELDPDNFLALDIKSGTCNFICLE